MKKFMSYGSNGSSRRERTPKSIVKKALELYKNGILVSDIAKKFNVKPVNIYQWASRNKVKRYTKNLDTPDINKSKEINIESEPINVGNYYLHIIVGFHKIR